MMGYYDNRPMPQSLVQDKKKNRNILNSCVIGICAIIERMVKG